MWGKFLARDHKSSVHLRSLFREIQVIILLVCRMRDNNIIPTLITELTTLLINATVD